MFSLQPPRHISTLPKIGLNESPVSLKRARDAMVPRWYPANGTSIGIEILGSIATDGEENFWRTEPDNLRRQFETKRDIDVPGSWGAPC